MARTPLIHKLLGRDLNGLLWRLLLVAAVLQFVLPGPREKMGVVLAPSRTMRLLNNDPAGLGDAAATAQRLNQPWAWVALAERSEEGRRPPLYAKATSLAPRDEAVLMRAAVGLANLETSPVSGRFVNDSSFRAFRAAARRVVEVAPDNAAGWYLLAAAQLDDRTAAMAAVQRGNRAPRCDDFSREALAYAARFGQARGLPEFESWLTCMSAVMLPHLSAYRQVARTLVEKATPAERLELMTMGARLRDDSRLLITGLVGIAIQQVGIAGPPDPNHKSPSNQTKEQQAARRRAQAAAFAETLRSAGQADQATWVERQAARNEAAKKSTEQRAWLVMLRRELDPHLAAYGSWTIWLAVTGHAALLLLCWALLVARRRRGTPFAWRARDLATVWCLTILPAVALSGLLAQSCSVFGFAALFGTAEELARAPRLAMSLLGTIPLPLMFSLAVLRALAAAWGRRHPESGRAEQARFQLGATRSLLLPSAALLLLLAWCAQVPAVNHRRAVAQHFASKGIDEMASVRAAMDAASPARLLPPR